MRGARKISAAWGLLATGSLLLSACWLGPNGDAERTGQGDGQNMSSSQVPNLHQLWTHPFGQPASTVLSDAFGLYTAVGSPSNTAVSLDFTTGATRWSNSLTGSRPLGMSQLDYDPNQGEIIVAQPSADGTVSIQRMDSNVGTQQPVEIVPAPGGAAAELATEGAETLVVYGSDGIELRTGLDREDPFGNPINNVGNILTNEALVPGGLDPSERTPAIRGNVTKTFQAAWIVAHKHLFSFLIDARQVTCPVAAPCGPFRTESLLATSANPVFSAPVLALVHGNAAFSSIVVVNETDNIVMAFDGGPTGGLQWSASLPNDLRGLTQAVTDGNDIDVAAPGKVEVFNIQNPNLPCHPNCAPIASVPLSDSTPPSHIILGADVIFVSHGSVVDAVRNRCSPGPCLPLWTHTMDSTVTGISESDGHLYVSTQTGVTAFAT